MPFLRVHAFLLYDVDHEADADAYVGEGCGRKKSVYLWLSERKIKEYPTGKDRFSMD